MKFDRLLPLGIHQQLVSTNMYIESIIRKNFVRKMVAYLRINTMKVLHSLLWYRGCVFLLSPLATIWKESCFMANPLTSLKTSLKTSSSMHCFMTRSKHIARRYKVDSSRILIEWIKFLSWLPNLCYNDRISHSSHSHFNVPWSVFSRQVRFFSVVISL